MLAVLQISFLPLTLIDYGHGAIIKHCDRPFSSTEEHDNTLIANHNSVVGLNDYVIHVGDFSFGRGTSYAFVKNILDQLNGKIIIVFGNHDRHARSSRELFFQWHEGIYEPKIRSNKIVCCHYPLLSWNAVLHGRPHVFGHVHSGPKKVFRHQPNSYDVGVDNNDFTPIAYKDLMEKLEESKKLPFIEY